jgi:hypothetical protein
MLAENLAGKALRDGELHYDMVDEAATAGGAQKFPEAASFRISFSQRQVRHSLAQPVVLFLKLLEAFHLVALQATKLLAPPLIRELRHEQRSLRRILSQATE